MKQKDNNRIGLSGTVEGIKYRLGVPNPYNRRRLTRLGPRHLLALRVLLSFVDASRLDQRFAVSKTLFTRRFPEQDSWSLLISLLECWVRTSTANAIVISGFAAVNFWDDRGRWTAFVRFEEDIIPIIKGMLDVGLSNPPARQKKTPAENESPPNRKSP